MPIIHLNSFTNNTCVDRLREIIYYFSAQTYNELLGLFPLEDESLIDNSLKILINRKDILVKDYLGESYYYEHNRMLSFDEAWENKLKYQSTLDFIRLLINSTDSEGYLLNDIPLIGVGRKPCTAYVSSNRKFYEIYDFPLSETDFYTKMIQTKDLHDDYQTDPNNPRIVIVENKSQIEQIKIKNVEYYALYNKKERTFILMEGARL